MSRIHLGECIISDDGTEDFFDFEYDIDVLEKWADDLPDLRLIIFDPITSFTSCGENSNSEVRRALKPLVDFAVRRNISILGLTHLNKKVDLGMINRTIGSRSWSAVPRMIWGIQGEQIENEDGQKIDTNNRFLLCIKNNLGPKPKGMKFSIEDNGKVVFDSKRFDMNMDDGGIQASRSEEIGDWLIEQIGVDVIPATEIIQRGCLRWGISKQRLGKIANDSGVHKRFSAAENRWVWTVQR